MSNKLQVIKEQHVLYLQSERQSYASLEKKHVEVKKRNTKTLRRQKKYHCVNREESQVRYCCVEEET